MRRRGFLKRGGGGGGNRTRVQTRSTTSSTYLVLSFDLTATTRTNTLRYGDSLSFRPWRRDTTKTYLTYMTSRGIATLTRQRISERTAALRLPVRTYRRLQLRFSH
ncbi:conserved hypothetical protein [Burkholderia sp. 8Y]|nr:conserved hypothetical protein [Burkholderia sp. 8Y]